MISLDVLGNVGGDFSDFPAFRNRSTWCPDRGREIAIEAYAQAVEEEILSSVNNGRRIHSNLSESGRKALKTLCRLQCNARVCLCFDSFGERTL